MSSADLSTSASTLTLTLTPSQIQLIPACMDSLAVPTLADLTPSSLNDLYDVLALPADDGERRRKVDFLQWCQGHLPEERRAGADSKPACAGGWKGLLRESMRERARARENGGKGGGPRGDDEGGDDKGGEGERRKSEAGDGAVKKREGSAEKEMSIEERGYLHRLPETPASQTSLPLRSAAPTHNLGPIRAESIFSRPPPPAVAALLASLPKVERSPAPSAARLTAPPQLRQQPGPSTPPQPPPPQQPAYQTPRLSSQPAAVAATAEASSPGTCTVARAATTTGTAAAPPRIAILARHLRAVLVAVQQKDFVPAFKALSRALSDVVEMEEEEAIESSSGGDGGSAPAGR